MQPRWRKVLADLWSNRTRTLLVVLSIAIGVFAVGAISGAYVILLDDLERQYQAVNPHSAIVYSSVFDDDMVRAIRDMPGVGAAEGRTSFGGRVRNEESDWLQARVTAIPPLEDMQINRLDLEDGFASSSLNDKEVYIERSALGALPVQPGDVVYVERSDQKIRTLRVAGIVHDVSDFSYNLSNQVYGYVTPETMEWLGQSRLYNQMYIAVAENPKDEQHVRAIAQSAADKMERSGLLVFATIVFNPGEHPTTFVVEALLSLLGGLGVLTVLLSGFLVVNTISALLSQHIQQIGIMKAVGARREQIAGLYLVLVLSFGLLALLIAAPLAAIAGYALASGFAEFLNFDPSEFQIVPTALLLEILVALLIPLLAALAPVFSGTRITVHEAISSYGLGKGRFGSGWIDRAVEKVRGLPRPLLISLRNTFRRKGRLALTLSTLTLGGAIFIAVFNVRASLNLTLDELLGYFLSDVNVSLGKTQRIDYIEELLMSVPGVEHVEGWSAVSGQLWIKGAADEVGTDALIFAPPNDSQLIEPVLVEGRWLVPEDQNAIVVTNILMRLRPEIKVGDEVVIRIDSKEYDFSVVGIAKLGGNWASAPLYANYDYISRIQGLTGRSSDFRIGANVADPATADRIATQVEALLTEQGIRVTNIETGYTIRAQQAASFDAVIIFLALMATLIALVGGLGLAGTMSMNVMERTREVGVLRAIGASNGAILQLVIVEGMLIGIISWALGAALGAPISMLLGGAVGLAFLAVPLAFSFSVGGVLVWLVIVIVLAGIASIWPALNAARITVRDALAYE